MIAGNLLYFLNDTRLYGTTYQATQKIKSGSRLYDRINEVLETLSKPSSADSSGVQVSFHSYHLENYYYFELKAEGRDSLTTVQRINEVRATLGADSVIKAQFTGPYAELKHLNQLTGESISNLNREGSAALRTSQDQFMSTSLQYQLFDIRHALRDLEKEFELYPFLPDNIRAVDNPLSGSIIRINLICFILGLFLSVAVREVKQQ